MSELRLGEQTPCDGLVLPLVTPSVTATCSTLSSMLNTITLPQPLAPPPTSTVEQVSQNLPSPVSTHPYYVPVTWDGNLVRKDGQLCLGFVALGPIWGNRRAIVIGINYNGSSRQLDQAVSNAERVAYFLSQRQYSVTVLLESQATKEAILEHMRKATFQLGGGTSSQGGEDSLFVYFCGHGSHSSNLHTAASPALTQEDDSDDAILPYDYKQSGPISLSELFTTPTPNPATLGNAHHRRVFTATVSALLDCPESFSGVNFSYHCKPQHSSLTQHQVMEFQRKLQQNGDPQYPEEFSPRSPTLYPPDRQDIPRAHQRTLIGEECNTILLSRWRGDEDPTSIPWSRKLAHVGSLTLAFVSTLQRFPLLSCFQVLTQALQLTQLDMTFTMLPSLWCSKPFNLNSTFPL